MGQGSSATALDATTPQAILVAPPALPDLMVTVGPIRVRVVEGPEVAGLVDDWERCRTSQPRPQPQQRLDLLRGWGEGDLSVVVAEQGGRILGMVPVLRSRVRRTWDVRLARRRIPVIRTHLRSATVVGETLMAPQGAAVHPELFRGVLDLCRDDDVLRFEAVAEDSDLADALRAATADRPAGWLVRRPRPAQFRTRARLDSNLAAYLASRLGTKARHEIERTARRFDRLHPEARLEIITDPAGLPGFLASAEAIGRQSWHAERAATLLSARPRTLDRLHGYAAAGVVRGYVLSVAGEPVAYVLGYATDRCLFVAKMAFAASWARFSPGNVLTYRMLGDLHASGEFDWVDFGPGEWDFKRSFGGDGYWTQDAQFIRCRPRPLAVLMPPVAYQWLRRGVLRGLRALGAEAPARAWTRRHLAR